IRTVACERPARHYGHHGVTLRSAVEKSRPATMSAEGPSRGANYSPYGGSAAAALANPAASVGVLDANRLFDTSLVFVARNGSLPSRMSGSADRDQRPADRRGHRRLSAALHGAESHTRADRPRSRRALYR